MKAKFTEKKKPIEKEPKQSQAIFYSVLVGGFIIVVLGAYSLTYFTNLHNPPINVQRPLLVPILTGGYYNVSCANNSVVISKNGIDYSGFSYEFLKVGIQQQFGAKLICK